jgi:ketosteroid isomerase-like protein
MYEELPVPDAKLQIDAVFRQVETAVARGTSADEIIDLLYHPDAVLVAEGTATAIRGVAAFKPQLEEILKGWGAGAKIRFSVADPVIEVESLAMTYFNAVCEPAKAGSAIERYRVLSGWRRTSRGWRVAFEMYAVGSL